MMKKIAAVLFVCIFMFSGCTTYNTNEKSYTYEDLSDNQKKVVDGVFEQYSKWASVHDSGKTILCTNVTFFMKMGSLFLLQTIVVSRHLQLCLVKYLRLTKKAI